MHSATPTATAATCPECTGGLTEDTRFVQWCQACGWNAHPGAKAAKGRGDRFRRRLNRASEERLYRRVTEGGAGPSALDGVSVAAYAFSGVVHLVTLGLAIGGVLLLVQSNWPMRVVGAVLLLVAFQLRPRLGPGRRARKRLRLVGADTAPVLHRLAAQVAAELGTEPPALIAVNGDYNASYTRFGVRRRVLLTLGLPLWETLAPEQWVALLGHEFGHGANGDARRGVWIGSALRSLQEWYRILRPGRTAYGGGSSASARGLVALGEMLTRAVMAVFAELVLLANQLLRRLTALSGRRAEYRADAMAARVAGPEATTGLLRALTVGSAAGYVRGRYLLADGPRGDFWADLREYVASIPPSERDRRLLVSQLDDSAVDTSHPPTRLRLDFVGQLPAAGPAIVLSAADAAAIGAELAPARAAVAGALL